MPRNLKSFLEDQVVMARDNQQTSQRIAPGSYGNGYDCGYLKAIQVVWEFMDFDPDKLEELPS